MAAKLLAHVAVEAQMMEEILPLKNSVILHNPKELFGNERLQYGGSNVWMVGSAERVANIVEQRHHDIIFTAPVAIGAGCGLQAMRQPIDRKAAIIARQFDVQGRLVTVEPYGSGNVNDTYLAIFRTTFSEQRFIVQRVRKAVFPDPEAIMQNMRVLTDHCHAKLEAESDGADRIWQLPKIIQTKGGEDWVTDANGDIWRAISQIASANAGDKIVVVTNQTPFYAESGGQAGDGGSISWGDGLSSRVADTRKALGKLHLHDVTLTVGPLAVGDVVKLDVDKRHVIVGPKEMLATRMVPLREINWLGDGSLMDGGERQIAVKVRSTRPPIDAILRPISETEAEVELLVAEEGVAPGQACVFYDPESTRVLGGGWIWRGY